jgi:nicotinamidase/pyrazinamidase
MSKSSLNATPAAAVDIHEIIRLSPLGAFQFAALAVGMAAGSLFLAPLADRFGRRRIILASVCIVSLGMLFSGFAPGYLILAVLRFLTGIGIGGILACATLLIAEYSSERWRNTASCIYTAGYPLGATLGGALSAALIARYGWRSAFQFGAVVSMLMVPVVYRSLPESVDFLITRLSVRRRVFHRHAGVRRHLAAEKTTMNRRSALRLLAGAAMSAAMAGTPDRARAAVPPGAAGGAGGAAKPRVKPDAASVLIVVDVQNCFIAGGTLAVAHGEDVVAVINRIAPAFANVVLTQDWHTPGHVSFASSHPGRKPFDTIDVAYGRQTLWPDHCVQGTPDAALAADLRIPQAELILRKGFHRDVDSYSAFREANRTTPTGLKGYLTERGMKRVFVCGLATDYCVAWTALDALQDGFATYVIEDACRGIDLHGSVAAAWHDMTRRGVQRIQSTDIEMG